MDFPPEPNKKTNNNKILDSVQNIKLFFLFFSFFACSSKNWQIRCIYIVNTSMSSGNAFSLVRKSVSSRAWTSVGRINCSLLKRGCLPASDVQGLQSAISYRSRNKRYGEVLQAWEFAQRNNLRRELKIKDLIKVAWAAFLADDPDTLAQAAQDILSDPQEILGNVEEGSESIYRVLGDSEGNLNSSAALDLAVLNGISAMIEIGNIEMAHEFAGKIQIRVEKSRSIKLARIRLLATLAVDEGDEQTLQELIDEFMSIYEKPEERFTRNRDVLCMLKVGFRGLSEEKFIVLWRALLQMGAVPKHFASVNPTLSLKFYSLYRRRLASWKSNHAKETLTKMASYGDILMGEPKLVDLVFKNPESVHQHWFNAKVLRCYLQNGFCLIPHGEMSLCKILVSSAFSVQNYKLVEEAWNSIRTDHSISVNASTQLSSDYQIFYSLLMRRRISEAFEYFEKANNEDIPNYVSDTFFLVDCVLNENAESVAEWCQSIKQTHHPIFSHKPVLATLYIFEGVSTTEASRWLVDILNSNELFVRSGLFKSVCLLNSRIKATQDFAMDEVDNVIVEQVQYVCPDIETFNRAADIFFKRSHYWKVLRVWNMVANLPSECFSFHDRVNYLVAALRIQQIDSVIWILEKFKGEIGNDMWLYYVAWRLLKKGHVEAAELAFASCKDTKSIPNYEKRSFFDSWVCVQLCHSLLHNDSLKFESICKSILSGYPYAVANLKEFIRALRFQVPAISENEEMVNRLLDFSAKAGVICSFEKDGKPKKLEETTRSISPKIAQA